MAGGEVMSNAFPVGTEVILQLGPKHSVVRKPVRTTITGARTDDEGNVLVVTAEDPDMWFRGDSGLLAEGELGDGVKHRPWIRRAA